MNWDPKKSLRIDRVKKQQRETKKIDYREMIDYDQDETTKRNNKKFNSND